MLAATQCIVIGPVCGCVCGWVCYHDNSKLHASILIKLGLYVKVMTISSWLNFGCPAPPGRGSVAWQKILSLLYYSQHAVFASALRLSLFFIFFCRASFWHHRAVATSLCILHLAYTGTVVIFDRSCGVCTVPLPHIRLPVILPLIIMSCSKPSHLKLWLSLDVLIV